MGSNPVNSTSFTALVFTNTQSVNANGQVPNFTLGNNGSIDDYAANGTTINLGTISLNPTAGNTPSNGTWQRNVLNYGDFGSSRGRIGAGNYTTTGYQYPNVNVGAIQGDGDMVFTSGYSNNGRGVVTLTQPCTYTGDTFMDQSSCRDTSDAGGMAVVRIGCTNALPIGTNLIFGRGNATGNGTGNGGELDLNGNYQQVASVTTVGMCTVTVK